MEGNGREWKGVEGKGRERKGRRYLCRGIEALYLLCLYEDKDLVASQLRVMVRALRTAIYEHGVFYAL